jgi:hypothetical protein
MVQNEDADNARASLRSGLFDTAPLEMFKMDLQTLNTLKAGDRIRMIRDHRDVGIRAGAMGTVTAVARAQAAPAFPTVYVQLDSSHPGLPAWDNELMLAPDIYRDPADEDRGLNSRVDPDSIVAGMETTKVSPADGQGRRWRPGEAEAA